MMAITLICGVLMAIFLFRHRHNQANASLLLKQSILPLAGYNLAMGLWCAGHLIVTFGGISLGLGLIALNPLMPTLFLHFVVNFIELPKNDHVKTDRKVNGYLSHTVGIVSKKVIQIRKFMPLLYGCSLIVVAANLIFGQSTAPSWLDFPAFVLFDSLSWFSLAYTILIGLIAHSVLLWGYLVSRHHKNNRTKTIVLLFIAAAWGFLTALSLIHI